jgi:hypothetical protein
LSFVKILTDDQPFIPKYFGYDVNMNKKGAPNYMESVNAVKRADTFTNTLLVVAVGIHGNVSIGSICASA